MPNGMALSYKERLQTFEGYWTDHFTAARQLAAIGHACDRAPLEALEQGSRCISCSAFVRRDQSVKALQGASPPHSYEKGFDGFNFHHPHCTRLQVRIPLEPQALLAGLHGYRLDDVRSKFERMSRQGTAPLQTQTLSQSSSLFNLPVEIRIQIYSLILPSMDPITSIVQLNSESSRLITRTGYQKTGRLDYTKINLLRTCRAVNGEAMDLLYSNTTFQFDSTKIMYLFLRSISNSGRELIKSIDIRCGGREDAIAFALLASCEKLQSICIRLPRPSLLFPRAPIWVVDGMDCLRSLKGLKYVTFGHCESNFNFMDDTKPDAAILREELTRLKGNPVSSRNGSDILKN